MPSTYKDRFPNIDRRTVEATRRLIAARPWRGNPGRGGRAEFEAAYRARRAWLEEASAVYGLRIPSLRIRSLILIKHPYGCYVPANNTIHLPKFSVTTLAHEFRHAYQHQTGCPNGDEEDARGWSVSLIYLADPAFYRRAVERGLLLYW
jgi:hypothetical protein